MNKKANCRSLVVPVAARLVLALSGLFISTIAVSQVAPPTSDVAGAGAGAATAQRATINQATGTVSYAVPLMTVSEGGLSINLAAAYSSSGHRLSDMGGDLGMGWNLDIGLSLTREIRGIPDDEEQGSWHLPIDVNTNGTRINALLGWRDSEADVFRYRVGGAAGAFYLHMAGSTPVINQVPLTDNIIVPIAGAGTYIGFKITTPDGTTYTFGGIRDVGGVLTPLAAMIESDHPDYTWKAWATGGSQMSGYQKNFPIDYYPVNIANINGSVIAFSYASSYHPTADIPIPVTYGRANTSGGQTKHWTQGSTFSHTLDLLTITGMTSGERVDFAYHTVGNYSNARLISDLHKNIGSTPTSVRFEYDNFTTVPKVGEYPDAEYPVTVAVPALKRIVPYTEWHHQGSGHMLHYEFSYHYDSASPLTYMLPQMRLIDGFESHYIEHDYLGYASKRHNFEGLPYFVFGQSTPGVGDREPVPSSAKKTLLKSIREPYTAITTIDYEPHERAVTEANIVNLTANCQPSPLCTTCAVNTCAQQSQPHTFWVDDQSIEGATFRIVTTYANHSSSWYFNARLQLTNQTTGQTGLDITWTMSSNADYTSDLESILSQSFGSGFADGNYRAQLSIVPGGGGGSGSYNNLNAAVTITTSTYIRNEIVPGLRVKSIKYDDRNGNLTETLYTYTRESAGTPSRSSGMTVGKPRYYRVDGNDVSFASEAYGAQSFSNGSHVIYREISEETVGLGRTVSVYDPPFETVNSSALTSIAPRPIYDPGEGRLLSRATFAAGIGQPYRLEEYFYATTIPQYGAVPNYTRVVNGRPGIPDVAIYQHPLTLAQRLQSVKVTEDGRQTLVSYTYHSDFRDATPVEVHTSYPDGTTSTQRTRYISDYDGEAAIKQELTSLHATRIPFETTTLRNGAFLSKESTYFGFYLPQGGPSPSNCPGCRVAPWRSFSTGYPVNSSGSGTLPSAPMWIMTKEIYEIFPDGSPRTYRDYGDTYTTTLERQGGLVTKVTHGLAVTSYQYQHRQLTSTTDPNGRTTTYQYDNQNRLRLKTSTCDGASTEYQYNPVTPSSPGFVSTVEIFRSGAGAPRQHLWRTFDGAGRVIQTAATGTGTANDVSNGGANGAGYILTRTTYDRFGRTTKSYEPITVNGTFTNWGRDLMTIPFGSRYVERTYEVSPRSRVLSETLHNGYRSTYQYGYNTSAITGVGPQSSYPAGTLTTVRKIDFEGYVSETLADATGSAILTRRFAAGSSVPFDEVYYGYDVKSQLIKVVPGLHALNLPARHTLYTYDALGRKLTHQDPGRAPDIYTYDAYGRLATVSTPYTRAITANHKFRYVYNAFGQPWRTWLTAAAPSVTPPTTEIVEDFEYYDAPGTPATAAYRQLKTHTSYLLDNPAESVRRTSVPAATCGRAGTLTEVGLTHAGTQVQTTSTSTYDGWNRPATSTVTHTLPGRQVQTVNTPSYRADHSVASVYFSLATKPSAGAFTTKYSGTAYEVWSTTHGELQWRKDFVNGSNALQKTDYTYDALGRLTAINKLLYGESSGQLPALVGTSASGGSQRNAPASLGLSAASPIDDRDLFHEAIRYDYRSQGGGFPGPIVHRGLIQETVKSTLGRRPVHESYRYDARLRLTGFEAQEQVYSSPTSIFPYTHSRHARAGYAYDDWNRLTALHRFGYTEAAAPVDELFDNLQHRYNNAGLNAPTQVFDYARKPRGHSNTSTSSTAAIRYTYNAAGDVVYDQDKGLTYSYNALGLVSQVLRADGTGLQYRYAADGTLVTSTETQAAAGGGVAVSSRVFYLAGDRHDAMSGETYVHTPFGATLLDAGLSAKHVGFHADHLGNIILAYSDLNGDGFVDPSTEILEENRYYPYGLKLPVYTRQSTALPFAYNGAEEQNSFGLHLTTYRTMAPEVAFWGQVDPKAALGYHFSPYAVNGANPISYNDPEGDWIHLAIGAAVGAVINVATHWDEVTDGGSGWNWKEFGKAAGIGAVAGFVGAATGGAALGAAGLSATSIAGGAVAGGVGAAYSSPILGVGNNIAFGDPYSIKQWGLETLGGGVVGGVGGGVANLIKGKVTGVKTNIWTDADIAPGRTQWAFANRPLGSEWGPRTFYSDQNSLRNFSSEYSRETTSKQLAKKGGTNFEIWDKTVDQAWESLTDTKYAPDFYGKQTFLLPEGGGAIQTYIDRSYGRPAIYLAGDSGLLKIRFLRN